MTLIDRPDWQRDAACRGKPAEWWFPEGRGVHATASRRKAIAVCQTCPVIDQCEQYADSLNRTEMSLVGVWAGKSGRARNFDRYKPTEPGPRRQHRHVCPCGQMFYGSARETYCSGGCLEAARRRYEVQRENERKESRRRREAS